MLVGIVQAVVEQSISSSLGSMCECLESLSKVDEYPANEDNSRHDMLCFLVLFLFFWGGGAEDAVLLGTPAKTALSSRLSTTPRQQYVERSSLSERTRFY